MNNYFFRIPTNQLDAATALQREITGRPDDPPIFELERARGASRAESWLYAHGQLWTPEQTQELADRIGEVGGVATLTFDRATKHREPVDVMEGLGKQRRPDLPLKSTADLVALARELGITPTPQNRETLIDLLEIELTEGKGI